MRSAFGGHNSRLIVAALTAAAIVSFGCNSSQPKPAESPAQHAATPAVQYPPRPSIAPPATKVVHQDAAGITLVVPESTTSDQLSALVWQLHDKAQAHTLDSLQIDQKLVDARDPIAWFHIYRGAKCASEKYTKGPLPCGASYHAAAEYTLGSFSNKLRDDGAVLQDENHETHLWDPNASASH